MTKFSWSHALALASLAGALTGCSTVPENPLSANPLPVSAPDAAMNSDEPIPRLETPSRSGNPDTYVVFGRRYRVKETSEGYREEGIASWYGWEFHGRKTSSGPLFNMFELTAAHKSLPLPTYVQVTNLENGRHIVVKVTDRGPFVGERLIDLSYAAAERLGMLDQGTARVEIAALAPYQFLPNLAARRAELRELLASRQNQPEPDVKPAVIQFAHAKPVRSSAQAPGKPPAQVLARVEREREKARLLAQAQSARLAQASTARDKAANQSNIRLLAKQAQVEHRSVSGARIADIKGLGVKIADGKTPIKTAANRKPASPVLQVAAVAPEPKAKETKIKAQDGRTQLRQVAIGDKKLGPAEQRKTANSDARPQARSDANNSGKKNIPTNAGVAGRPETRNIGSESKPTTLRLASLRMNRPRTTAD